MWHTLTRLWLAVLLIGIASGILLFSDRPRGGATGKKHVAIFQHASTIVLDDGVRGMIDGLKDRDWVDGQDLVISSFNAEGDVSTANQIAQAIVAGDFNLVLTSSTPSMQTMANANRNGRIVQVFGLVADPYSAGVGLNRDNPMQHPKHLVGLGTRVAVPEMLRLARKLFPGLAKVGMVWNPGESNSQASMIVAREVCKELNVELLEASAESTSGVADACDALLAQGSQALAVGGDNTVSAALKVVIASARKGKIPVLTSLPGDPNRGTLLDVGTNFYEAGRRSGQLAGDVLRGTDPATVPIRDASDLAPHVLVINATVLRGLKDPWRVPADVLKQADVFVDEKGVHKK